MAILKLHEDADYCVCGNVKDNTSIECDECESKMVWELEEEEEKMANNENKGTMEIGAWEFSGDVNPVEHGGIWVRKLWENEYEFIKVQEWFDDHIAVAHGQFDITEDWIDQEGVESYGDTSRENNPHDFVGMVVSYYGIGEFDSSPDYIPLDDRAEGKVRAFLKGQGITF